MNNFQTANLGITCKNEITLPISIQRLNGQTNPDGIKGCEDYLNGNNFIIHFDRVTTAPFATTFTMTTESPYYKDQITCTGSGELWSTIILKKVLSLTNQGQTVTFSQWPSFSGKSKWNELVDLNQMQSLNSIPIMTEVILHELFHSVIVLDPTCIAPLSIYSSSSVDANGRV